MTHTLTPLPYALDALEPYISRETLEYHHGKHVQAYVDALNNLIVGTDLEGIGLEQIILQAPRGPIFNNAAQIWNHNLYFAGMAPNTGGKPLGTLATAINADFGSFENFQKEFLQKATTNFGSGWTWLVYNRENKKLEILNTQNANNILANDFLRPILACDVWEHSYYIDYRNARAKYIENFWNVVNWNVAEELYKKSFSA